MSTREENVEFIGTELVKLAERAMVAVGLDPDRAAAWLMEQAPDYCAGRPDQRAEFQQLLAPLFRESWFACSEN